MQTKAHHKTEYSNFFDFAKPDWVNADHGDDLMYVFGMPFIHDDQLPADGQRFAPDEAELSKRMIKAWSNFARNGNPGWTKYDLEDKTIKEPGA